MRKGDKQENFSQRSFRDANEWRKKAREKLFIDNRDHPEQPDDLDYLHLYPKPIKTAIKHSLIAPIPTPLPPIDVTTISFYRRSDRIVYQTRIPGCIELDPHFTHQSLHMLSMATEQQYPNFAALTRQFQRDLKLYLSLSNDIRTMALIAAGNHIIGKEKDILTIAQGNITDIWVLFNHIFSGKISYEALLPYVIKGSQVAFRAFYQYSNITGHESIAWFFDKEEVVESLLKGLESPEVEIKRLTLRIFGNVLGEEIEHYASALLKTSFLDSIFKFMMSSDPVFRKDACWVLANFCSYECAATIVLRKQIITEKLVDLLYNETSLEIRKEIAHIFNYIISLADKQLTFEKIVSPNFLQVMATYLEQGDVQLSIITCNVIQGLLSLGEEFKDENEQNVVALIIRDMDDLPKDILKGIQSQNCLVSEACSNIDSFLKLNNRIEEEL